MYCPGCGVAYRDGFSQCSDCHMALVAGEPLSNRAMTDREYRTGAARLVKMFRDGEITNDQFEDRFGRLACRRGDRALKAIRTAIWTTYSDLREHKLGERGELSAQDRLWFDRIVLFLQSDLPYLWERNDFVGLPLLSGALRWLLRTAKRLVGSTPDKVGLRAGPDTEQERSVWPFQSDEDFRHLHDQASSRSPQ